MAGIYDRIKRDSPSQERIAGNLLHAAFVLRATGKFNDVQIVDGLNSFLTNRGGQQLAGEELSDLADIANVMDARVGLAQKLAYAEVIRATFIAVEIGLMGETAFNSTLEINGE